MIRTNYITHGSSLMLFCVLLRILCFVPGHVCHFLLAVLQLEIASSPPNSQVCVPYVWVPVYILIVLGRLEAI